ncbi:TraA family conjugative transfer protein [Rubrivivax gelatinosus]|uniref:TraA family conjugative transfer protein n=1 Tax=Rubrivivax gelatinosus TaxID=28068 RepID=UPI000314C209|nr:TraA family conjugative transfer protein [Rubrivivax gelatinosus]MBG6083005.1 conjugal transfer pilus assembly protein TraA [Rubrivivax gelatinosus]
MKAFKGIPRRRILLALTLVGASTGAYAVGIGSNDFDAVTTRLQNWMQGSLGKTFALGSLAVGLAIGVVKQSVMSVVVGAAVALSASIGPDVLSSIFTATM